MRPRIMDPLSLAREGLALGDFLGHVGLNGIGVDASPYRHHDEDGQEERHCGQNLARWRLLGAQCTAQQAENDQDARE